MLFVFLSAGFAFAGKSHFKDYEPSISEVASEFYVLMSRGDFSLMREMLTDELIQKLMDTNRPPSMDRLVKLLSLADDVCDKKIKVFLSGERVNVRSLDGGTVEVRFCYDYRITDSQSGSVKTYRGADKIIMKRIDGLWLINDIQNEKETVE